MYNFIDYPFYGRSINLINYKMNFNKLNLNFKADYLADRIAIISSGKLKCCGSPLFLKSIHGAEYTLVLTRNAASYTNKKEFDQLTNKIKELVEDVIPDSNVVSNINSELKFQLSSKMISKYGELFEKLESLKEKLKIINIGINFTTMEKVFLK